MVTGIFIENTPFIQVVIRWKNSVQSPFFILDTGFTGDLQVTPEIANELGLKTVGITRTRTADGRTVEMPIALAIASMENTANHIQVLISDSSPLAGISFLSRFGYTAIVDCKDKNVFLKRS